MKQLRPKEFNGPTIPSLVNDKVMSCWNGKLEPRIFSVASLTAINQGSPLCNIFWDTLESRQSQRAFLSDICPLLVSFTVGYRDCWGECMLPLLSSIILGDKECTTEGFYDFSVFEVLLFISLFWFVWSKVSLHRPGWPQTWWFFCHSFPEYWDYRYAPLYLVFPRVLSYPLRE